MVSLIDKLYTFQNIIFVFFQSIAVTTFVFCLFCLPDLQEADTEGTVLISSNKSNENDSTSTLKIGVEADSFKEEKEVDDEEQPSTSSYNPRKIRKEISQVEGNKKKCLTIKGNCK